MLESSSFPEALATWVDTDEAEYELGRALGVFSSSESFNSVKGVFWGDNPLGRALYAALRALVSGGIIEVHPDDEERYRWKQEQPSRRVG